MASSRLDLIRLPALPREVWILHAGQAVSTFGNGLIGPFVLIYLTTVRGFAVETAGFVVATLYLVAIGVGLVAGTLVDRVGARRTATFALVLLALGFGGFAFVANEWHAFALAALGGVGSGSFWPSFSSLAAAVTPRELRHASSAVQRVLGNLALGLGGLTGGVIATTASERTFAALFLLDGASFLLFLVLLRLVPAGDAERPSSVERTGYGVVLRDRGFVGVVALHALLMAAGVAMLNSMLPLFAKTEAGVSEEVIGGIFLVNTITIVLLQLPVARLVEGRRRMAGLFVVGTSWAACWTVTLTAGVELGPLGAAIALMAIGAAFGIGECLIGVIQGPLVADLAPERIRGRYMALYLMGAQIGFALGPALGGLAFGLSPAILWLSAASVCAAAGIAALVVERALPPAVRLTPSREAVRVQPAGA